MQINALHNQPEGENNDDNATHSPHTTPLASQDCFSLLPILALIQSAPREKKIVGGLIKDPWEAARKGANDCCRIAAKGYGIAWSARDLVSMHWGCKRRISPYSNAHFAHKGGPNHRPKLALFDITDVTYAIGNMQK